MLMHLVPSPRAALILGPELQLLCQTLCGNRAHPFIYHRCYFWCACILPSTPLRPAQAGAVDITGVWSIRESLNECENLCNFLGLFRKATIGYPFPGSSHVSTSLFLAFTSVTGMSFQLPFELTWPDLIFEIQLRTSPVV